MLPHPHTRQLPPDILRSIVVIKMVQMEPSAVPEHAQHLVQFSLKDSYQD